MACMVRGELFDGGDLLCSDLAGAIFMGDQVLARQEHLRCRDQMRQRFDAGY